MFPDELLDFYNKNKNCKNTNHIFFNDAYADETCAYYKFNFDFDPEVLLNECKSIDHLFGSHRSGETLSGYKHQNWQSLTLHGIDMHKTMHCDSYGYDSIESYRWTELCSLTPNIAAFCKSLPYSFFDRVRIMKVGPGGYIMPHSDGKQRMFGPLNIAINNPEGCEFVFEDCGTVPFEPGKGFVVDVSKRHIVINKSHEPRYHIIALGGLNANELQQ